jgi:hypothetical protein
MAEASLDRCTYEVQEKLGFSPDSAVGAGRKRDAQSFRHFETSQSDAFAAPGLRLASGTLGFNCGIRVQFKAKFNQDGG